MKRCIVCGNVGDDNSAICDVCGAPYSDAGETGHEVTVESAVQGSEMIQETDPYSDNGAEESPAEETRTDAPEASAPVQTETEHMTQTAEEVQTAQKTAVYQNAAAQQSAGAQHRVRTSGPQIYGQNGTVPGAQDYRQQGMIRRNVQGRSGAAQNQTGSTGAYAGSGQAQGQPYAGNGQAQGQPYAGNGQAQSQQYAGNGQAQGQPYAGNGQAQGQPYMGNAQRQLRPTNEQAMRAAAMQGQQMRPGSSQRPPVRPMQSQGQKAHQIVETSRKMMKSPLFLLVALLHTVYFGGSVAAIFMNQLNYSQAARLISNLQLPGQLSGYTNTVLSLLAKLDSGMIAANLVLRIPDFLFCVGLWLIFMMAVSARERMSGVGFVFVKIDVIINLVLASVVMIIVLVVAVAVVVSSWVSGSTTVIAFSVAALVAVIVVVMFVIMYYFCYLATLKTCRLNGNTGESYGRVSGYVAIVHILGALAGIINLLSGIVNNEIAGIVGSVGRIGWMLLFAFWIFRYRAKMEPYEE
jgi:hypothetical protein